MYKLINIKDSQKAPARASGKEVFLGLVSIISMYKLINIKDSQKVRPGTYEQSYWTGCFFEQS